MWSAQRVFLVSHKHDGCLHIEQTCVCKVMICKDKTEANSMANDELKCSSISY